jgi:enoyl-CoA hydratase/carnithine racemase
MVLLTADNSKTKARTFCSGGDVVSLIGGGKEVDPAESVGGAAEFFRREYALNHLIATYRKPIISLLDGITSNPDSLPEP